MDIAFSYIIASFIAGLLMFLAPCTFPLVPAFIASLTPHDVNVPVRRTLIKNALLFCIGFMSVFVILGALSGLLGAQLDVYKSSIVKLGGFFLVLFGIGFTGIFSTPVLLRFTSKISERLKRRSGGATPLVLGVTFALGWSPCTGPLLASILLLATGTATIMQGVVLLIIFSLGIVIPFMLVAVLYAQASTFFKLFARYGSYIQIGSAFLVTTVGFVLIFSDMSMISYYGVQFYGIFGYVPQCTMY